MTNSLYAILLALAFALAAGLVGSFALMRRMLLASDVISHLALPGLGLAFLLKINPLVGGGATLFVGTLIVWKLEQASGLATEAAIGVVFAAALAIGAAVTPKEDLIEALFGGFQPLSLGGLISGLAAAARALARSGRQLLERGGRLLQRGGLVLRAESNGLSGGRHAIRRARRLFGGVLHAVDHADFPEYDQRQQ